MAKWYLMLAFLIFTLLREKIWLNMHNITEFSITVIKKDQLLHTRFSSKHPLAFLLKSTLQWHCNVWLGKKTENEQLVVIRVRECFVPNKVICLLKLRVFRKEDQYAHTLYPQENCYFFLNFDIKTHDVSTTNKFCHVDCKIPYLFY